MAKAREHFPNLWTATRDDLCFATTNRQAALRAVPRGRAEVPAQSAEKRAAFEAQSAQEQLASRFVRSRVA